MLDNIRDLPTWVLVGHPHFVHADALAYDYPATVCDRPDMEVLGCCHCEFDVIVGNHHIRDQAIEQVLPANHPQE